MKIISSKLHGFIDYLVVIFLAVSPMLFGMEGFVCTFTYVLAAVHLVLTLCTNFGAGIFKIIPLNVHGYIEFLVGILLVILAFTLFKDNELGKTFYTVFGAAVFVTALLSDYSK